MSSYQQDPQQPGPYGPAPGWQPPAPPKQKHTVRNVILVLLGLCVLGLGGCLAVVGSIGNEIDKQSNEAHIVVYTVSGGSVAASLTYSTDGSTTIEQSTDAALPWSKTFTIKGLIPVYQISAQNGIGETGEITCTIEVDGKVVKTATGSGEAAIASCTYSPSS